MAISFQYYVETSISCSIEEGGVMLIRFITLKYYDSWYRPYTATEGMYSWINLLRSIHVFNLRKAAWLWFKKYRIAIVAFFPCVRLWLSTNEIITRRPDFVWITNFLVTLNTHCEMHFATFLATIWTIQKYFCDNIESHHSSEVVHLRQHSWAACCELFRRTIT